MKRIPLIAALLLAVSPVYGQISMATAAPLNVQNAATADTLHVTVGQTIVLTSPEPLARVYVGDPHVVHSFCSGAHEVLITSKTPGISSLVLWDKTGKHRLYTVFSDIDLGHLRTSLSDALPEASLQVEAREDSIQLSGVVSSQAQVDTAVKLASDYSKSVMNDLRIVATHGKQVQLKLRIVEVDRTRLEQFGLNFLSQGNNTSGITTQQFGNASYAPNPTTGIEQITINNPLNLLFFSAGHNAGITVQDLENKQILQVLAEPTLTTISGQQARFLSGGEFPFPVVQGGTGNSTAITIQFRPYGVKVDFTPTVNSDGTIHLKVNPEVSALDYTNAVTISGFTIPALSTRRAETEVEIRNGESFVVSGILDHRTTEALSKVPGIADIPILGQLFRSRNINHSVVELVIVVTATVVDPLTVKQDVKEPKLAVPLISPSAFDKSLKTKILPGSSKETPQ